jgi:PAS domain S-box-containing protein
MIEPPAEAALREYRFLAELAAATQHLVEPADVMAITARMVAEELGADRCAYAEVEAESVFVITGDYARDVPSIVGRWPVEAFGPECVRCMLAGEPYVMHDVDSAPFIGPEHVPAYRATTIVAVICVPLHKQGKFTAAMAVHQKEPRRWTPAELALVTHVVARCWEALERARVSRTLLESEARYRAMFEASPGSVQLIAADGTILQANAAAVRAAEAELIGRSIYDFVAPEHRERFAAFNQRVCAGESGALDFELVGSSGTRRIMEANAVPLPSGAGFVQLSLARDVSQRVRAERALADSRARLDYAVRLSGVGFWYCDLPFDELIWDPRVREHFFIASDARVTLELFYERMHPEDREHTREAIARSIRERTSYDVEYRTVEPGMGTVKWVRALGGTAYAPDGTPIRFDGVTVDVTAQRLDQDRLSLALEREREQAGRLREQDHRRNEFLATLAHELRNPLAPIRTGLQVLRLGANPAQTERAHEMMDRQLGHMVRMIDDLLDISRVTLGKVDLRKQRLDLRSVVNSAIETADLSHHRLTVSLPEGPLPLDADPTRLSQVFANLLNNAIKYTPASGRIEIAAERDEERLRVHVRDDGVGIPADMLARVFDMFTQVERTLQHAQGGLGIGLTLVRSLVEMHGGNVSAESAGQGRGSTFTVELPLAARAPSLSPATRASDSGRPALKVLVVDDNEDAAESLELLLQLQGHQTCVAHSGPEAVAAARRFQPQLVFLDIGLPVFNGYEVARQLRADATLPQPYLVALTGWGSEDDKRQAMAAGFDRHLVKPFDTSKLSEILARAPVV